MSKKLAVTIIIILLVLNLGVGYFLYFSIRAKADSITTSAKDAASTATTQNASLFGLNTSGLPKSDVEGVDPAGITRYPKAIRSVYTKQDGAETVEYKVLAPVNVVLAYYKTQLAKNDWVINFSSSDTIVFNKAAQKISITGVNKSGITTYTIVLK